MENKIERPLILEIEEAKNELIQCVNKIMQEHQLPCYFIEPVLKDIYIQIQNGAKNELETAKAQMIKQQGAE